MENIYKIYSFKRKNILSKTTIPILLFRVLYHLLLYSADAVDPFKNKIFHKKGSVRSENELVKQKE